MEKAFDLKFSGMILYHKSFNIFKFSSKTEEIEKNPLIRERCIQLLSTSEYKMVKRDEKSLCKS